MCALGAAVITTQSARSLCRTCSGPVGGSANGYAGSDDQPQRQRRGFLVSNR